MALKPQANGEYHVRNEKEAIEALRLMQTIKEELDEIREANGVAQLEQDSTELKKAATRWAVESGTERINFDPGFHATLVQQFYGAEYVATDDDITDDMPKGTVISLEKIIERKFKSKVATKGSKARKVWFQITKRVVDRAAVDQAVADGLFTVDDVSPSFVEKAKAPYLRVFEE